MQKKNRRTLQNCLVKELAHLQSEEPSEIMLPQEFPESAACNTIRQSDGEIEELLFRSPLKSNRKITSLYGDCGESKKLFHRK